MSCQASAGPCLSSLVPILLTPNFSACLDPKLPLEPAVYLSVQRRGQEVKIKREPHLARRCKEDRDRLGLPSLPTQIGRCTSRCGLYRSTLDVAAANLGPTGISIQYAGQVQFAVSAVMAIVEGRRVDRHPTARRSKL